MAKTQAEREATLAELFDLTLDNLKRALSGDETTATAATLTVAQKVLSMNGVDLSSLERIENGQAAILSRAISDTLDHGEDEPIAPLHGD
jgi:hypothetical protein